jgi:hypothetical protein
MTSPSGSDRKTRGFLKGEAIEEPLMSPQKEAVSPTAVSTEDRIIVGEEYGGRIKPTGGFVAISSAAGAYTEGKKKELNK